MILLARIVLRSLADLAGLVVPSATPLTRRRIGERLERLSPKPKQQLLSLIDTFIGAEALKQPNGAR